MSPTILSFDGKEPSIAEDAYIAPGAVVIGDATVGSGSSVWFGCVLRADIQEIRIGRWTNVQDSCILHVDYNRGVCVGNRVTVGHGVQLHGCTVEDEALIGMGAIVLNGATVRRGAIVGAGAVVPEGMEVPADTVVFGIPARVIRKVTAEEHEYSRKIVEEYLELAKRYSEIRR